MTNTAQQGRTAAASSSARSSLGMAHLLAPVSTGTFLREYWERQPLVVHRDEDDYYHHLLTLDDIDRVLSLTGVALDHVRVVVDGRETPIGELRSSGSRNGLTNSLEALYERHRTGSTIVVNALEGRWEPLKRLAAVLGEEFGARFQMNIYITPAGSRGFAAHYDDHDVFIAQVHGGKRWRLHGTPTPLPLPGYRYDKSQPEPELEREVELTSGDLMYLPRGTVHAGAANDRTSVHITLGVHQVLYAQLIKDAVDRLFADDERFRTGLPVGFASDEGLRRLAVERLTGLLDDLWSTLYADEMVDGAAERVTSIGQPSLRGHLVDLDALGGLGPDTPVWRRPGIRWTLQRSDDAVRLDFHDKSVRFPAHVTDEVRFAAESNGKGFTAASVPGDLDAPGRLVLVHTLVREGFLTLHPS